MIKTPWDIAEAWYGEEEIARAIKNSGKGFPHSEPIPRDVDSPEFAKWITHQYRLAMAKGIQLGRENQE